MKHIIILFGGPTPEHDVSLVSAKNVYSAIIGDENQVTLIGITKDRVWKLVEAKDLLETSFVTPLNLDACGTPIELTKRDGKVMIECLNNQDSPSAPVDIAFPVIHGPYGEDGTLQNELNAIGLPFVGTDATACKVTFDKELTKKRIGETTISQGKYLSFSGNAPAFETVEAALGTPFFVKPANMGSSIGISKVSYRDEYPAAISSALEHDSKVVLEKGIVGREIECAILELDQPKASGLGEVCPNHEFYSYEAKYLDPKGADLIIPALIEEPLKSKIRDLAIECFETLECRDYARVDFFVTEDEKIYFNEINTYPGFTAISQFPLLWKQEGIEYKELINRLIEKGLSRSCN